MSEIQREIYNAIIDLPENMWQQALEYLTQLKDEINAAPEHLIIRSKEDLAKKLEEGLNDNGELSFEEVISKMNEVIAN